jgi:hypothetical protein
VLDTQPWDNANQAFAPRTFLLLRLSPSGSELSQARLAVSVPGGQLMTGFALCPDGRKLAIAVQPDNDKREPDLTEVKVITLATGVTRTWTANGTIGFGADDARSLSWADNERTLAFDWEGSGPGIHTGVWLVNLSAGGGSLLADSREAVTLVNQSMAGAPVPSVSPLNGSASPSSLAPTSVTASPSVSAGTASPSASLAPATASASLAPATASASLAPATASASPISVAPLTTRPTCQEDSIITLDGSTIVCGAITPTKATGSASAAASADGSVAALLRRGAETEFIGYSVATGKVARVLGHWTFGSVGALSVEVLWSNASGSVLIGVIPDGGGGRVGVISGNEFTPLPLSGAASTPMQSGTW